MRALALIGLSACWYSSPPPPSRFGPAPQPLELAPVDLALPVNAHPLACSTAAIQVMTGHTFAFSPVLAQGTDGMGMLWVERVPDGNCENQRYVFGVLREDGSLAGAPVVLSSRGAGQGAGQLVWAGGEFLATYGITGGGVELVRVSARGAVVGSPVSLVSGGAILHQTSFDGRALWLAWSTGQRVFVRRFDPQGAPLGPELGLDADSRNIVQHGNTILQGPSGWFRFVRAGRDVALAWAGTGYFFQRFTADGAPIGGVAQTCCAPSNNWMIGGSPGLAASGDTAAMVWMETGKRVRPLVLTRFDAQGRTLGDVDIGSPAWVAHPTAVSRGTELGVAWRVMGDVSGVHFARVGPNGDRIGKEIDLHPGVSGPGCDEADAIGGAPTSRGYALAWSGKRDSDYQLFVWHACVDGK
jgi:hypothetical protein